MCGHVGIINRETNKLESEKMIKFFQQALYCGALRGKHGTGIMAVDTLGETNSIKKGINSSDFLDLKSVSDIIEDHYNVFLCGHNRWATTGSHSNSNAHPFNHNSVTMFHNGTLSQGYQKLAPNNKFEVDSEYIAHALAHENSHKDALEKLDGAYSLVFYDSNKESLFFARNSERPMYFGTVEKSNSMLYASEKGMIEWLASQERCKISISKIIATEVGVLYEFPLDIKENMTKTKFNPKETFYDYDYEGYYQRGNFRNRNVVNQTTALTTVPIVFPNGFKKGDKVEAVKCYFEPYTNSILGKIIGYVGTEDHEVVINGVTKTDFYSTPDNFTVSIVSYDSKSGIMYATKVDTALVN